MKQYSRLLIFAFVTLASLGAASWAAADEVYAIADDGTPLTWTVTLPTTQGPWPAVLVIHGGRFVGGDPEDASVGQCAQDLADAGYAAFAIQYRLAPPGSLPGQTSDGRFPDQYDDVHLAVQAARNDARCNGQVGAVGGSAGGTHAAWCAATGTIGGDRLDVAVCLSGAYDFSDFRPDPNLNAFIDAVTNYVNVDQTNIDALRAASPAWVVDASVTPLFLAGTKKDPMPAVQPGDMVARLEAVGAHNYQLQTLPGSLHSFAYWTSVKRGALTFLASGFAAPLPTPTPTPSATPSPTATPTPTASPSATPTPSPTATPPASPNTLLNISTRARAGSGGDTVLIGGFILGPGNGTKRVALRAIGPSLGEAGISEALADPSLQLFDATGHTLSSNDNWMDGSQAEEISQAGLAPNDSREAALIATLAPGAYTAVVTGSDSLQNIALVEVYDLDGGHTPQLLNISTRGQVELGDGVMIAGTIIGGTESQTLLLRGLGPSFAGAVSDALADPNLSLVDGNGTTVAANNDWQDTQKSDIIASGLPPASPREAAILATLPPGSYTALLSDAQGASGIGLLEIYNLTGNQTGQ
ncbi:MAG TPA: alpha/beta hydrolase [Chthoniobacterales bacterium]